MMSKDVELFFYFYSLHIFQPSKRLTIGQIKSHEYFRGIEWKDVIDMKYPVPISLKLTESDGEEDCTTNNPSVDHEHSEQNSLEMRKIDLEIQNEFEDLFPDYAHKSFRSFR